MPTWVIAHLTFKEAGRRKILWAALLLGAAFLVFYGLGFHFILAKANFGSQSVVRRQTLNVLVMMGMYAVNFLTVLMTVLTSADMIASEISSGTIQTVVTKPMRRWEVVLGKWLGSVGMLGLYIGMMAGGVIGIAYVLSGYVPPNPLKGLGLIWLESTLVLSLTLLCGTSLSTLATGVTVLGFHGLAFIGGWVEQIGAQLGSATAIKIGILASVIMPSEALWKRAVFEMQSPLLGALGATPFSNASTPSHVMIWYASAYMVASLYLATRRFKHRDL